MVKELRQKIENGEFAITVELEPPKGINTDKVISYANKLKGKVDCINITDCPMANMRMSPIAVSYVIRREANLDAIFHLTCRDRNIIGLQSELLGAAVLGVKNILVLTGDPPKIGDHPDAKGVFEVDSVGLVKIADTLNKGFDMSGNELNVAPRFFIGVAANPCAHNSNEEMEKLLKKIEAGAHFIQTQPVYEIETLQSFMDKIKPYNIPVLAGILPLKSYKMTQHIIEHIPGIEIPEWVEKRMEAGGKAEGIKLAKEFLEQVKTVAQGAHIMPVGNAEIVLDILDGEDEALNLAI
ncbi:MAG: methylenetetrahydrofolate reductase [Bacillota bacterium]